MSLRIATVTANPSVDVCVAVDRVLPQRKLRCGPPRRDPGGGGLNAARVIRRLGGDPGVIFAAGGDSGQRLQGLVRDEKLTCYVVPIAGDTREDFTADERTSGDQYRFVLPGPRLTAAESDQLLEAVWTLTPHPDLILASGSLPRGVASGFYGRLAMRAREAGRRFAVDASGSALRAALSAGVWMAKPNLAELEELVGTALPTQDQRVAACQSIVARGRAEVVALTLGAEGALLVTAGGVWRAPAIDVTVVSAIGAGDSFMGAFVWAVANAEPLPEAFRWAVAAGAAALTAEGTQLCRAADTRRLKQKVCVQRF